MAELFAEAPQFPDIHLLLNILLYTAADKPAHTISKVPDHDQNYY
jgi:hypothetical protein